MSETSVYCVNAVVYEAQAGQELEWIPLGNSAWSEMHLFRDDSTGVGNFRIVAWIPETTEVILNVNVLDCTTWTVKSSDFAEIANPSEPRYGIYFPDAQLATATTEVVNNTIQRLHTAFETPDAAAPPPPPAAAAPAQPPAPEAPEAAAAADAPPAEAAQTAPASAPRRQGKRTSLADFRQVNQAVFLASSESNPTSLRDELEKFSEEDAAADGPATERSSMPDQGRASTVTPVTRSEGAEPPPQLSDLKHQVHVSYNEYRAAYEGLPDEWQHMNQQFGVEYPKMPKSEVEGYDERIPSVLVMMKRYLMEHNARDQVGIFRLAPDKDDCNYVKEQINSGQFEKCDDVNIVANLVKVWFRDMPAGLFNSIPEPMIFRIADMPPADVPAMYHQFSEPHKSLILWLLDLMCEFVVNEEVNKMSAKNMSIVMSPNLYQTDSENPMAALTMAQKIADFTTKILAGRLLEKWNYDARVA